VRTAEAYCLYATLSLVTVCGTLCTSESKTYASVPPTRPAPRYRKSSTDIAGRASKNQSKIPAADRTTNNSFTELHPLINSRAQHMNSVSVISPLQHYLLSLSGPRPIHRRPTRLTSGSGSPAGAMIYGAESTLVPKFRRRVSCRPSKETVEKTRGHAVSPADKTPEEENRGSKRGLGLNQSKAPSRERLPRDSEEGKVRPQLADSPRRNRIVRCPISAPTAPLHPRRNSELENKPPNEPADSIYPTAASLVRRTIIGCRFDDH
jgi:hypothetical protein